ncbi:MAG: 50S ribosome-binding GTPase [Proteobacteria bacterium]|nr:50S ribosome-binding GTPase [Pseudomonadota bacterium]
MPRLDRPLRLILLAAVALALAAVLWTTIAALRSGLALWQELRDLPIWTRYAAAIVLVLVVLGFAGVAHRLLRSRPRTRATPKVPQRADVQTHLDTLAQRQADIGELQAELAELDRRARSEAPYVAVFGEISAGKSSLIRALAHAAIDTDVLGGTTRAVAHYAADLDGAALILADVPGTHEVAGAARESIARDEALRAHIVLYVCAGDLTREQDAELRWLRDFGKPLVLVLNKIDLLREEEVRTLLAEMQRKYRDITAAQVRITAGGSDVIERLLADGRRERIARERTPDVAELATVLARFAYAGAGTFEPAREAAVLTRVDARANELEAGMREREADAIIAKYTRRAVIGALAAVMPGSDLVIQAVLATGLIRELSKLFAVPVRDIDIDAFVSQAALTVRTSASLVLAIAGNAAKAFPGLGTLGGGALHAIAYGLIFDSLGHAVARTLDERRAFDQTVVQQELIRRLADHGAERLKRIAQYALRGEKENS